MHWVLPAWSATMGQFNGPNFMAVVNIPTLYRSATVLGISPFRIRDKTSFTRNEDSSMTHPLTSCFVTADKQGTTWSTSQPASKHGRASERASPPSERGAEVRQNKRQAASQPASVPASQPGRTRASERASEGAHSSELYQVEASGVACDAASRRPARAHATDDDVLRFPSLGRLRHTSRVYLWLNSSERP